MCFVLDEAWKDLDGFEGLYRISNLGNVMSLKQNKSIGKRLSRAGIVSKHLYGGNKNPRVFVNLRDNFGVTTRKSLHILIAEHFVSNPNNYTQVRFKNSNVYDWEPSNLEWVEQ